jgi:very-short-patch-repair endonuclease
VDPRLEALQRASARLPAGAAFSGYTALWLHGLDFEPCNPIEATVQAPTTVATRAGMVIKRRELAATDVISRRGLNTTTPLRTIRDLCRRLSLTESVVVADAALHSKRISLDLLTEASASHGYGVRMLRKVLPHVEPKAESPMETRMRMLYVLAGLGRPEAQVPIYDGHKFLGRIDLYYREARLGLEYDGATHKDTVAEDNRRQNLLLSAGIRLLRFTASDIYNSPDLVVAQVRKELRRN